MRYRAVAWLAALVMCACGAPPRVARLPREGERTLRVLTWNVNYGLAGDASVVETLRDLDADVVFLEETNAAWERELRTGLSDLYPSMVFVDRGAAGGMAVLARDTIVEQEVLEPPPEGWFPSLRVVLATSLGEVQFVGVHLHPQISDSGSVVSGYLFTGGNRLAEIEQVLPTLDSDRPTVLLGDFNEGTGGSALQHLAAAGYHSALDDFDPGRHTWRWSTSVGTISFQFDHIVHDDQLTPIDVHAVDAGRSDHIPVLGVFVRSETLAPSPS